MKISEMFRKRSPLDSVFYDLVFPSTSDSSDDSSLSADLSLGSLSNMFEGLSNIMPNPDPVLKKLGWNKDIDAYKELLSDPQLYGAIENNRKPGTTALKMYLNNPDCPKPELEFFKQFFDKMIDDGVYDNSVIHALDTPQFGRMVFGTVWERRDGYFLPVTITPMPHVLTKFDYQGKLKISTDGVNFDYPTHPAKYFVLRHKPTLENPYGEALLSRCYWNIRFKKDGFKLWALFTEKFGMPWVKASYNPQQVAKSFNVTPQSAADLLLSKLSYMAKDGVIIYPDGVQVDLTAASEKSSIIYENLVRICDEQNTKLQLGHSGATESTSGDKLSNDTTATTVRENIINSDKKYPIALWNHIIYWIHQFNFSGTEMPRYDLFAEDDVDKTLAERDSLLVPVLQLGGLKPSKKYMMDKYGFEEDDLDVYASYNQPYSQPTKAQGAIEFQNMTQIEKANRLSDSFVEYVNAANSIKYPDQKLIDSTADANAEDTKPTDKFIKTVVDYIQGCDNYDDAIKNIADIFSDMDTGLFEDKMQQMLFIADIVGRLAVKTELGIDTSKG